MSNLDSNVKMRSSHVKKKFPSHAELKEVRAKLEKSPATKLLPKNATAVDRAKFSICEKFVIYKNERKLTQRALAEKIGIDEALMSKILHYNIEDFTTDRLLKFLSVLYPNVELDVKLNVA